MEPEAREELEALAQRFVEQRPCGATPPGYNVPVECEREPGHPGRHWNDRINWPAA